MDTNGFDGDASALEGEAAPELAQRIERLRALRAAWGVLAPSGLSNEGRQIAETGRAVTDLLASMMQTDAPHDAASLAGLDTLLDEFETSMQRVAAHVPIPQLRSTLPRYLARDRRGLLDLLDVFLGAELEAERASDGRIFAIDYLITLLCTSADGPIGAIRHDPVTLTPRLQSLCAQADEAGDPALEEIEAEFFAASNMDAEDLRAEFQQRTLRSRKAELGSAFFASRILRAIVTYNAALLGRVAGEIIESGDWGFTQRASGEATPLFESPGLQQLAAAARRRARGEQARPEAPDRIIWALDFSYLDDIEKRALESEALGTADDPLGTAILVGLICRSLAVLSIDLQDAGLSPDEVSDGWVPELTALFQAEINQNISSDQYKVACALSAMKDKFLFAPLRDHLQDRRTAGAPSSPRDVPSAPREGARELVRDALEESRSGGLRAKESRVDLSRLPWARIAQAALLVLALALGGLLLQSRSDPDLGHLSREALAQVSPHLEEGKRSGRGAGPAFVGTLDDSWLALTVQERVLLAEELVNRLRDRGVEQIMIFDEDSQLRIQAIGSQPVRLL